MQRRMFRYGLVDPHYHALLASNDPGEPPLPAGGTWRSLAPMPQSRQEVAAAVLGGRIFVIGGYDSEGMSTSSVFVYEPSSDSWSTAAPIPIVTNHPGAAVAAGRLFAFGGVSRRAFAYDANGDSWSEVAPMQFQHGDTPAVGVLDDRIYVAGGTGPSMFGNEVEVYDVAADRWNRVASMNVGRNHCAGAFIGDKFYVAAGRPGKEVESAFEVYDPQGNAWTSLPRMPTGRSGVAAAGVNGKLYVFGGEGNSIFGDVEVFDPASNTWTRLARMPTPRHGIFAAMIGDRVYLPGGATRVGVAATTVNEVFVPE